MEVTSIESLLLNSQQAKTSHSNSNDNETNETFESMLEHNQEVKTQKSDHKDEEISKEASLQKLFEEIDALLKTAPRIKGMESLNAYVTEANSKPIINNEDFQKLTQLKDEAKESLKALEANEDDPDAKKKHLENVENLFNGMKQVQPELSPMKGNMDFHMNKLYALMAQNKL
jgi:hypothetical protein